MRDTLNVVVSTRVAAFCNSGASGGHVFHASGPCDKLDICERER